MATIAEFKKKLQQDPKDFGAILGATLAEYINSIGVRGDNTPEAAKYLGYLDFKELYPDVQGKPLRAYFQKLIDEQPSVPVKSITLE